MSAVDADRVTEVRVGWIARAGAGAGAIVVQEGSVSRGVVTRYDGRRGIRTGSS